MASEFLIVAEQLLKKEKKPMSPDRLVELARERGLFSDNIAGKTPHQTMKSKLSVEIRKKGRNSKFVRTEPGKYYLRELLEDSQKEYKAKPFTPPPIEEKVLVFPNSWLDDEDLRFQGITTKWESFFEKLFSSENIYFKDRLKAESDERFKQVVTYILVTHKNQILSFKRGSFNYVADYLKGSLCIGFGGHVTSEDRTLFSDKKNIIYENAARELKEELLFPKQERSTQKIKKNLRIRGILNVDHSNVGDKHFAIILQFEINDFKSWKNPVRGEKSITQLKWIQPDRDSFNLYNYEYWSQLCLLEYFLNPATVKPNYRINRKKNFKTPHILCVLGPIGSGKTETTGYLKDNLDYKEVNSGKVLAKILGILPVPETPREEFQKLAWEYINHKDAPKKFSTELYKEANKKLDSSNVVIDGIRQVKTLKGLIDISDNTKIASIYVHTPFHVAYELYKSRTDPDLDFFGFREIRSSEVEREVEQMIKLSDVVLYNWFGKENFLKIIEEMMEEVISYEELH